MSEYSVLLADDEKFVCDMIQKKLNWQELGFCVAGYARNGIEALEMVEDLEPDVIMTDIKMPYMDGLTLCRKVKERFPGTKFIIFSGFDEFEYAKEAIKIEAEEYILKPIDSEELAAVFRRIREALDRDIDEKRNINELQEYYLKSLPVLQENFYVSLLEGRLAEQTIKKYASDYQIRLDGSFYVVAVLSIHYHSKNGKEMEVAPFLLSVSVQKLVEEQLGGLWTIKTLFYTGDIVVVAQLSKEEELRSFTDRLDDICRRAGRICRSGVTAGIGTLCSRPVELPKSYSAAKNAISYALLYGRSRAINIEEIGLKSAEPNAASSGEPIVPLLAALKINDKERLKKAIHTFVEEVTKSRLSMSDFKVMLMKLVVELNDFVWNYDLSMDEALGDGLDLLNLLMDQDSMEAMGETLLGICSRLQDRVSERRKDSTVSFVSKAKAYVRGHYADRDIGIDTVCGELGVSSSYFSTAFKKTTGKTFINYLTEYRMQQAVKLLETGDDKTYIIADKVGYSDPNYFSYVFKKCIGCSPSKYRATH